MMAQRIKSNYHLLLIFLCFLTISPLRLKQNQLSHLQSSINQQQQFNYLLNLQTNYAQTINSLSINAQSTRSLLNQTSRLQDRISILQSAVTLQRSKIGNLSTQIVPDPNSGYFQCERPSKDNQKSWINQSNQIETSIQELQQLTQLIPECDQIKAIQVQINKLKQNLENLKRGVSSQCQQNLVKGPTVYQTNIYQNNNWILGSMTMDQLVDQYYQRSLKYTNITNCPSNRPFMPSLTPSSSKSSCIQCTDPNRPYFDFSTRSCISCGPQMSIDITNRKCAYLPKNSNYTFGINYKLQPLGEIPAANPNLTSCPQQRPFFNNTLCISCPLPKSYFQISESKCVECPAGQVFNLNIHLCVNKINDALTILDHTEWVTNDGNITRVYEQRNHILQQNKTTKNYYYCNQSTPFYDSLSCITCDKGLYFNLDTLKCVSRPQNLQYDNNMHYFLKQVPNYEMSPNASRYIANQVVTDDPNIPNCNQSFPHYDRVSCIICRQPFSIFNFDTKQCIACNNRTFYQQKTKKCQNKPSLFVYGNLEKLLATKKTSIADYNSTLQQSIRMNPQMYPDKCLNPSQYAAITKCVECNQEQYFNVQDYKCSVCDGDVDIVTSLCKQRMYYLVNSNASNLILPDNTSIQDLQNKNQKQINQNPLKYSNCNISHPYPYNNKTQCRSCPAQFSLYDVQKQSCTKCPDNLGYDSSFRSCRVVYYLTNFDKNVIISSPYTLNDYITEQKEFNKTRFTKKCPLEKPYAHSPQNCIDCEQNKYFDLKTLACIACQPSQSYEQTLKGCVQTKYLTDFKADRILQEDNYTKQAVNREYQQLLTQNNKGIKIINCTINNSRPYAVNNGCIDCPDNKTYFSLKIQACVPCPQNSQYWSQTLTCQYQINITNFDNKPKIIQAQNQTLAKYRAEAQQSKKKGPWKTCPLDQPFSINGSCQRCPQPITYFFLANKSCGACDNYYQDLNTCPPKPNRFTNLSNYQWITNDGNADRIVNRNQQLKKSANGDMCPQFYDQVTKKCINCQQTYYFNFDNGVCERCPEGKVFDINIHMCAAPETKGRFHTNTDAPDRYFLYGGWTFDQLQTIIKQNSQGQACSSSTPYYDNIKCIRCPDYKKYFNLRYSLCQVCLAGEVLRGNDCYLGNDKVWRMPSAQNVYPYLFGQK